MRNKEEKNPQILNNFLNYLYFNNYSNNTITAYSLDLLCFFNFIKIYRNIKIDVKNFNIFILSRVREYDILAFLTYLSQTCENNPYTRQRKLTSIRIFYNWLFSNYPYLSNTVNPAKNIPSIEKVVRFPRYLSLEQSKKISTIFTKKNCKYPLRNNTIIYLFLNTGLRISELSNINISDINFKEKYIKIIGKGNRERKVLINENTKQKLLKYINSRNTTKNILDIDKPLFLNKYNNRLGINGIENVCQKAFNLIGIDDKRFTAHTLRHTAATIIYQYVNKDILVVKDFLGHKSILSTEIYTHLLNENIRNAINNNPLNDFEVEKVA